MANDFYDSTSSELEREYEYEMDNLEMESDSEYEEEYEEEYEQDSESDYEDEFDNEMEDFEFETDGESESEYEFNDSEGSVYADRFFELSQMEFEVESELDNELNGLLGEIENEYFFGKLKGLARNPMLRRLAKKAAGYALKRLPAGNAIKGITQLARGNLKGSLMSLAKTALAAHPAGAAALPALSALGFESSQDSEGSRAAWNNYVDVSREAYENLAENLNESAADPLVANELARNAMHTAVRKVQNRVRSGPANVRRRRHRGMTRAGSHQKRRVVYLGPGESIVIRRRG